MSGVVPDLLVLCAGAGLVLHGVRALPAAVDEVLDPGVRHNLERVTASLPGALLAGALAAVGLQAAEATVIAAMALLQRSVLLAEGAVGVVLGAVLGAGLLPWLGVLPLEIVGPALVLVSAALRYPLRGHRSRRVLTLVWVVGLLLLGWGLLRGQLTALLPAGAPWLDLLHVASFPALYGTLGLGAVAGAFTGSGALTVVLAMGLVQGGLVGVPVGCALALGGTFGGSMAPLLSSVALQPVARRLAVLNAVVQGLGVALVGLFFHSFLSLVLGLVAVAGLADGGAAVAAAASVFGVGQLAVWFLLVPVLTRALEGRGPSAVPSVLSAPVRRLLANVPDEALEQARGERDRVLVQLKVRHDRLLTAATGRGAPTVPQGDLRTRVGATRELLATIVAGGGPAAPKASSVLWDLEVLEGVLDDLAQLTELLQLDGARLLPPGDPDEAFVAALRTHADGHWARALASDLPQEPPSLDSLRLELHRAMAAAGASPRHLLAAERQMGRLQSVWRRLHQLQGRPLRDAEPTVARPEAG